MFSWTSDRLKPFLQQAVSNYKNQENEPGSMLQGTLYNKGRHANCLPYRRALCSSARGRKNNSHSLQQKADLRHVKIYQAVLMRHRLELRSRSPLPETPDSARWRTGVLFAHHKFSKVRVSTDTDLCCMPWSSFWERLPLKTTFTPTDTGTSEKKKQLIFSPIGPRV